jgi:hypothetical protein
MWRDGHKGEASAVIHVVLPIRLGLTAGLAHDGRIADTLLDHLVLRTIVLGG